MFFQSLFPSFAAELSIAIGIGALLLGLSLVARQLILWLGSRLTPAMLMITSITLQLLLVLGVVLLVFVFGSTNIGWLLLMLAAAFAVGANAYRPKEGGPPAPAVVPTVMPELHTKPAVYSTPVEPENVQPAVIIPEPAVAFAVAEAVTVSEEMAAAEEPLPVALPEDIPIATVTPAVGPMTLLAEAPSAVLSALSANRVEAPILDTEEQPILPALPIWRPWQSNIPAPLARRQKLGKRTIRVLHGS